MNTQSAILGGGCFWCLEAVFQRVKGVQQVTSGYAGGARANPSYEQICTGATGHAEVVKIDFDAEVISFEQLLTIFFAIHDPTSKPNVHLAYQNPYALYVKSLPILLDHMA